MVGRAHRLCDAAATTAHHGAHVASSREEELDSPLSMRQPSHSPVLLLSWQVIKNRFQRMFLPSQSLDTVSPTDLLLCFEVLSPELAKERVVELQVQQVSSRD